MEKIATYENGLDLFQTIAEMQKRKMRPPTNLELDERLVKTNQWESEKDMYPCRSGVFMCYPEWEKPFGKKLEWGGCAVIIPKKFRGKKQITLVCNYPDLKVKGKTFSSDNFTAIKLPREDGWYDTEPKFGLPIGEKKERADSRRHLWRYQNGAYCGLVRRWCYVFGVDYRRYFVCYCGPYGRFGVFGIPLGKGKAAKAQTDADELARLRMENAKQQKMLDEIRKLLETNDA